MKATNLRFFAAVAMLLAGVSAFAQATNALRVNIPFDFMVGSQKLAAGNYTVEESEPNGVVTLYGIESKQSAIVLTEPAAVRASETDARLTFEKHDGASYLVRVLTSGGGSRALLMHSAK